MLLTGSLVGLAQLRKERLSEVEDISIEASKTEKQREKMLNEKGTEYPRTVG